MNCDEVRSNKVSRNETRRKWDENCERKQDVMMRAQDCFDVALRRAKNIISQLSQQKNTRRTWLVTGDYSASRSFIEHPVKEHLRAKRSKIAKFRVAQHDTWFAETRNTYTLLCEGTERSFFYKIYVGLKKNTLLTSVGHLSTSDAQTH